MAKTSDPRTIITPYAFKVAPELLGTPLAHPFQRLVALVIDLMLIALLSSTGALPLGIAAVIFFIWGSTRRSSKAAMGKFFRVAIGCFGFVALSVTVLVVWAVNLGNGEQGEEFFSPAGITSDFAVETDEEGEVGFNVDLAEGLRGLGQLRSAETREEAQAAVARLARSAGGTLSTQELRTVLREAMPDDRSWSDEADDIIDAALRVAAPEPSAGERETFAAVDALSLDEVLAEYRDKINSGDTLGDEALRTEVLRVRIQSDIAGDTLAILGREIEDQRRDLRANRQTLQATEDALEEAEQGSGFFRFLQNLLDETILAFGWGTIYLTLFLTVLNGQTPGKKAMGIRVVQIDNRPLSWWASFERVGGYAAGLATGLLGFAQIFWDANRQAIHDKVSETVVIKVGKDRLTGPWVADVGDDSGPADAPTEGPAPGVTDHQPCEPG